MACWKFILSFKSRPKWFESINKNVTELFLMVVLYTQNALLKQVCPGVWENINKQGFCMIGSKIK